MNAPLSISIPTNNAKVGIPDIAYDTWVRLQLKNISQDTNEKGPIVTFEFELMDPASNTDGGTILPGQVGSKVFDKVYCYGQDDKKPEDRFYVQKICKRIDAILHTGDPDNKKNLPPRPEFNGETAAKMLGGILFARMGASKQQDGSPGRGEIKELKHPEDMKQ